MRSTDRHLAAALVSAVAVGCSATAPVEEAPAIPAASGVTPPDDACRMSRWLDERARELRGEGRASWAHRTFSRAREVARASGDPSCQQDEASEALAIAESIVDLGATVEAVLLAELYAETDPTRAAAIRDRAMRAPPEAAEVPAFVFELSPSHRPGTDPKDHAARRLPALDTRQVLATRDGRFVLLWLGYDRPLTIDVDASQLIVRGRSPTDALAMTDDGVLVSVDTIWRGTRPTTEIEAQEVVSGVRSRWSVGGAIQKVRRDGDSVIGTLRDGETFAIEPGRTFVGAGGDEHMGSSRVRAASPPPPCLADLGKPRAWSWSLDGKAVSVLVGDELHLCDGPTFGSRRLAIGSRSAWVTDMVWTDRRLLVLSTMPGHWFGGTNVVVFDRSGTNLGYIIAPSIGSVWARSARGIWQVLGKDHVCRVIVDKRGFESCVITATDPLVLAWMLGRVPGGDPADYAYELRPKQ